MGMQNAEDQLSKQIAIKNSEWIQMTETNAKTNDNVGYGGDGIGTYDARV